jgi:hypothetical protein
MRIMILPEVMAPTSCLVLEDGKGYDCVDVDKIKFDLNELIPETV